MSAGRTRRIWLAAAIALAAAGCREDVNFSQYPGFAAYFAAYPPAHAIPGAEARALAARFRPHLFLPPGQEGPIDFYADYIAQGRLYDGAGRLVSAAVTRTQLNRHKGEPRAMFAHSPTGAPAQPTLYARVETAPVVFALPGGPVTREMTFITYTAVFRRSGLPAGLPRWQKILLDLIASTTDWHQLDHYTALTLALDEAGRPVAVTFQDHNYLHSYLIGRDIALGADGRLEVDIAIGSNELYPHLPGRRHRRAANFPDARSMRYLMIGADPPWLAADDITDGAAEIDYALAFLPPDDAFYRFAGFLGERRLLPGRSGPPGADYNTLPALKPPGRQLLVGYWHEDDSGDLARFEAALREADAARTGLAGAFLGFAERQGRRLYRDWQCPGARRKGCAGGAAAVVKP